MKKRTLLSFLLLLTAIVVKAQGNDLVIVDDDAKKIAFATFKTDKNGNRISNSYSGDVVIPSKSASGYPVTYINHETFEGCVNLKSVRIPTSVKFIDYDAFRNSSLTEITIPASVDSIAEGVFFGMSSLKKVVLKDGPSVLRFACGQQYGGEGQFSYSHQAIEEAYIGRTYTTTWGDEGQLDSPLFQMSETLKKVTFGDQVKAINPSDFIRCDKLESVTFGKGIQTIGKEAFYNCTSLQAINLVSGLKTIETEAFYNCKAAKTIILPKTLKTIGWGAFKNCESVTELTIPASVTKIEDQAFRDTKSLKKVTIAYGTSILEMGYGQQYGGEGMFMYQPLQEAYLGRIIKSDVVGHFRNNKSLAKVTIADNIKTIKKHEFAWCDNLESVTFGKGVQTIETEAFADCKKLSAIELNEGVETIENEAFYNCKAAKTIILPKTLKTIGWGAFKNCESVTELTIPASVTKIDDQAFRDTKSLKKVTIAYGTSILEMGYGQQYGGEGMFMYQPLQEAYLGRIIKSDVVGHFRNNKSLAKVTIADNIKTIKKHEFAWCDNLESVTFGKGVQTIETEAFVDCKKLSAIELNEGVETIENEAFYNCKAAKTIILPKTLKTIGWGAFKNCESVTELTIPASVTKIEDQAFRDTKSLKKVTIADGADDLEMGYGQGYGGEGMFMYQPLQEAYLGRTIVSDASGLFRLNKTLTKVTIGKNVKSLNIREFAYCDNVASITSFAAVPPTCESSTFDGIYKTCKLTVLDTNLKKYKAAAPWSSFTNIAGITIKVKLNKTKATLLKDKTLTLKATVTPSDLADKSVTWKSSNKKVATVSSKGKVTAVKAGTATITCTNAATGAKATCKVTVIEGVVTLNATELFVEKGLTKTLKATVTPETLDDKSVTWTTSNKKIATVSSKGKVKGVKYGTVTITCTSVATGAKATCTVTVGDVALSKSGVSVKKGKTVKLTATVYPTTLEDQSVTWKSSNKKIATVSSAGKVKGIKAGTVTITCTSVATGLSATCTVTVVNASSTRSLEGDDDDETTGIESLEAEPAETEPFDVYDLSGRKVLTGVTSLDGLPNGVYIVNGKKMLKK